MTDGRTERARVQREHRELQILDAALRVFSERGYHGTSISHLVDAAGVARGTFYLYFTSKQAVFLELLDRVFFVFRSGVSGVDMDTHAGPLKEQLVGIVERMLFAVQASRPVATILFREAVVLEPAVIERVRDHEAAFLEWIRAALANGVRLGLLRPHDPGVTATLVYGSLRQVIDRYLISAWGEVDIPHLAEVVVDHHMHGLTTAPEEPP